MEVMTRLPVASRRTVASHAPQTSKPHLPSVKPGMRKPASTQMSAQWHERACLNDTDGVSSARRWVAGLVAIPTALALVCAPPANAEADIQGTFVGKCAGCHMNGGNILAAGASLFPQDLERNGYADPEAMYNLIYRGKGRMPGYGEDCAPKGQCTFGPRLSDEDISGLVTYVLQRADVGWK